MKLCEVLNAGVPFEVAPTIDDVEDFLRKNLGLTEFRRMSSKTIAVLTPNERTAVLKNIIAILPGAKYDPNGSHIGRALYSGFTIYVKPTPGTVSNRVQQGTLAQDSVVKCLRNVLGDRLQVLSVASTGATSSQGACDVLITIDGKRTYQLEVKSSKAGLGAVITLYDRTVSRTKPIAEIDQYVAAITGKKNDTLAKYVDRQRKKDQTQGYPGDVGVTNVSGKVTQLRIDRTHPNMANVYELVKQHFQANGDDYLVVHVSDTEIEFFRVDEKQPPITKDLNDPLPLPAFIELRTYGSARPGKNGIDGRMRIAVKIRL